MINHYQKFNTNFKADWSTKDQVAFAINMFNKGGDYTPANMLVLSRDNFNYDSI